MPMKEKRKLSQQDLVTTRQRVREFFEGKFVTILMAAVTIFALFGDDFRLWFTTKRADVYIDGALIFALVAFTVEILVNSCVVDEFKYSFFFWLDIIATVSICVDVPMISDQISAQFGVEPETGDAIVGEMASQESGSNKIAKLVKAFRLIRLIRIIKLYKYVVKSGSEMEEMRMREQQKQSQSAQQAALNRELEPSRLGRSLSEALTRRLIILVLVLLMALPAITYSSFDVSHQYGLRKLFWFGRSNCNEIDGKFYCDTNKDWMTAEGWEEALRNFISAASAGESEPLAKKVLWIHTPDYMRNGVVGDIRNVTRRETDYNQLWGALKHVKSSYDAIAIENIETEADNHRSNFKIHYECLSEEEKLAYSLQVGGETHVNPFVRSNMFKLKSIDTSQTDLSCSQSLSILDIDSTYNRVNETLTKPIKSVTNDSDKENLKFIYRHREYFKTLHFDHDEISGWLKEAAFETMLGMGLSEELSEYVYSEYAKTLEECYQEENTSLFDFHKLIFEDDQYKSDQDWITGLTWLRAIPLKWLQRNWFIDELYWEQDPNCYGFMIDDNPLCDVRPKEISLLAYTPQQCLNGEKEGCDLLVSYARISIQQQKAEEASLQFMTTIFTCIILGAGAIMFANDTQELIILPITKMVGIIKTLADDPLKKPEPPQFDDEDSQQSKGQMKTRELQKTIFRIGNLLQMSFGQLGAIIMRDQQNTGDGTTDIMIPGHKINAIFMICRINQFVDYTEVLKTNLTDFLNKITSIVHQCAFRWDGWANKTDGIKFVITWKLPDVESASNDAERNEFLQEQRTEMADKSLIAAIKIISEIRRANQFNIYFRKNQMVQRFGSMTRPYLTFGLHLGWTIQGAIGSDYKIDACYLSPHLQIAQRLEELTSNYDMQIILSETLYNYMSLKARNTLRKIDVILMNTFANQGLQNQQEPMGLYTFDMSFDNEEISTISEDHQVGDLIKLSKYETINIENFKNKGVDYMFTLDGDIVGLQQHILEFNPIFRQAFKSYISGDWGNAYEHIERCLELWEDDGPTKALQLFMSYYQFQAPSDWANCRNIDESVNIEDLNQFGVDDVDDGEEDAKVEPEPAGSPQK